jgi:hypothetical protein
MGWSCEANQTSLLVLHLFGDLEELLLFLDSTNIVLQINVFCYKL